MPDLTRDELRALYADEAAKRSFADVLTALRENLDRFDFTARMVRRLAPATVLDLGCHIGLLGGLLRWPALGITPAIDGVDWAFDACHTAAALFAYRTVTCSDLDDWEAPGAIYDLVLATEILEHVEDPQALMLEAVRAARPGGHIILSTPIEGAAPDGIFHKRRVRAEDHEIWLEHAGAHVIAQHVERSHFTEPHWEGWVFSLGRRA